jgi:hypothetical protein
MQVVAPSVSCAVVPQGAALTTFVEIPSGPTSSLQSRVAKCHQLRCRHFRDGSQFLYRFRSFCEAFALGNGGANRFQEVAELFVRLFGRQRSSTVKHAQGRRRTISSARRSSSFAVLDSFCVILQDSTDYLSSSGYALLYGVISRCAVSYHVNRRPVRRVTVGPKS